MATVAEERARDYESAIAYNKSGIKKTEMGDFAGALEDFDHAIGLDPKHSLAYLNRALIHYDNRDFRAAIDDFQRAIEISPNTEWFRLFVWLAEMHLGQRKRADRGLADYFGDRINAPGQDRHARIAAFFLDKLTLAEFLPLKSPSDSQALFYAGMKCLFTGYKNQAARYLRSSVEINRGGPWGLAAQAELKALSAEGTTATATATTAERPSVPGEQSKAQPALPNFAGTWEMISSVKNGRANPVDSGPLVITQNGSMVRIGNRDLQISNAGTVGYQTYAAHDNAHGHEMPSAAQADLIDTLTWRIEGSILVFERTLEYKHTYRNHSPGTDLRVMRYRLIGK
jgi:tetratricopeptide (TPR) repeat protein